MVKCSFLCFFSLEDEPYPGADPVTPLSSQASMAITVCTMHSQNNPPPPILKKSFTSLKCYKKTYIFKNIYIPL